MDQELKNIIQGCKENDRRSQELLYKTFFSKMMSMCMRYAHDQDEALTILNDGFLKVFKKIDTFKFKGSFEGWVRRLVFNSLSDYYRKKSKQIKFLDIAYNDKLVNHSVLDKLYEGDILELIEQVPKTSAAVFVLYAIHGFTHKEIAETRNISIGTSKWHLSNARKILQQLIQKQATYYNHG